MGVPLLGVPGIPLDKVYVCLLVAFFSQLGHVGLLEDLHISRPPLTAIKVAIFFCFGGVLCCWERCSAFRKNMMCFAKTTTVKTQIMAWSTGGCTSYVRGGRKHGLSIGLINHILTMGFHSGNQRPPAGLNFYAAR